MVKTKHKGYFIMMILKLILESIILVTALSLDAFVASFAYGTNKIKIPILSALILTVICSLTLTISLFIGALIRPYLHETVTHVLCFMILFILGITKLFDSSIKAYIRKKKTLNKQIAFKALNLHFILNIYADPKIADKDDSRTLSLSEAISLALALSIDGLAVGLGAALANVNSLIIIITSLFIGMVAVMGGSLLGEKISEKINLDLSWLSGLLLVILAIMKL